MPRWTNGNNYPGYLQNPYPHHGPYDRFGYTPPLPGNGSERYLASNLNYDYSNPAEYYSLNPAPPQNSFSHHDITNVYNPATTGVQSESTVLYPSFYTFAPPPTPTPNQNYLPSFPAYQSSFNPQIPNYTIPSGLYPSSFPHSCSYTSPPIVVQPTSHGFNGGRGLPGIVGGFNTVPGQTVYVPLRPPSNASMTPQKYLDLSSVHQTAPPTDTGSQASTIALPQLTSPSLTSPTLTTISIREVPHATSTTTTPTRQTADEKRAIFLASDGFVAPDSPKITVKLDSRTSGTTTEKGEGSRKLRGLGQKSTHEFTIVDPPGSDICSVPSKVENIAGTHKDFIRCRWDQCRWMTRATHEHLRAHLKQAHGSSRPRSNNRISGDGESKGPQAKPEISCRWYPPLRVKVSQDSEPIFVTSHNEAYPCGEKLQAESIVNHIGSHFMYELQPSMNIVDCGCKGGPKVFRGGHKCGDAKKVVKKRDEENRKYINECLARNERGQEIDCNQE